MPVFPLGASVQDDGVRFAVASTAAEAVEVCLIGADGSERRVELPEQTYGVWHGLVPGVGVGQRYGYRVHGRYDPPRGIRCNPAKLLVDPYARRITGSVGALTPALGYHEDPMSGPPSTVDSLGSVPLSVVTEAGGPGPGDRPEVPWPDTVIYEVHVRGFTRCHPDVPAAQRGTYLGLAHPAVIRHLQRIGVTAVELLPVTAFADEPALLRRHRRNYWGYSPLAFHAPHPGYASVPGAEVAEFRAMVAALHRAGIEVILDLVPNHTCEGAVDGTTLSYRGLDAPAYYLLDRTGRDIDLTGCGNTLDPGSPTVVRLVCDAMRYWAGELGVDGFRIDLASVLGRPRGGPFNPNSPLLTAITADPVLAERKLIAEPWDATGDGYRVGGFGVQWSEWNGRYRDAVRDFWRGRDAVAELASRLTGSSDLYAGSRRRPWASINFVTAHDGFTLRDLVSYQRKHNAANGEDNRDGTDDNRSQNFGVEGETGSPVLRARRLGTARAILATLLLSTGTPTITAGDERWRTQRGNNNPYCLDDETCWLDWAPSAEANSMTAFVARLAALRSDHPALRPASFPTPAEVRWWHPAGHEMTEADWHDRQARTLGLLVHDEWLLLLHADEVGAAVTLPPAGGFAATLDSNRPDGTPVSTRRLPGGCVITVPPRTVVVLRRTA
jgi:glycogen operon protein